MQRKAAERIAHASDIAVLQILALMQAPDTPAPVKLAAARDLLDRANVSGKTTVELEVPLWQQVLDGIVATVDPSAEMRPFAEGQDEEALRVASERFDAEAVAVEKSESARALENYRTENRAYDRSPDVAPEPRTPTASNGDDRPPPRHPTPGPRRIEPEGRMPTRRRVAGRR